MIKDIMNDAYRTLKELFGDRMRTDVFLAPYTTYKIGGPSDLFYEARTKEELIRVIIEAQKLHIPYIVLGGGTNILVSDTGVRGLVVRNMASGIAIKGMKGKVQGTQNASIIYLEADAGVPFNRLVRFTLDEGLRGLEMHLGLPGSVGGAVAMNSKWTHLQGFVGDVVYQAEILTPEGDVRTVDAQYFKFSYGKSILPKSKDILLSVVFALKRDSKEAVWKIANESISYRRETQPQGVSTAGCVFKNISKAEALVANTPNGTMSAGFLLDKSGCKDMHVGDAFVSPVHANFVVNKGKATSSDMIQLIARMKQKVKETFGVTLKEEIQFVGTF